MPHLLLEYLPKSCEILNRNFLYAQLGLKNVLFQLENKYRKPFIDGHNLIFEGFFCKIMQAGQNRRRHHDWGNNIHRN